MLDLGRFPSHPHCYRMDAVIEHILHRIYVRTCKIIWTPLDLKIILDQLIKIVEINWGHS